MTLEREPSSDYFQLRFHHLGIMEDLVPQFLKYSGGFKPWEHARDRFWVLAEFIKSFAENDSTKDRMMRNYFEEGVIESPTMEKDYLYVIDLIGTTKESFEKTQSARTKYLMELMENAFLGKKVLLIHDPDGYCRSCAIGKHCTDYGPTKVKMDLVYKEALERLTDSFAGIEKNGQNEMFISAELFFDPLFYKALAPLAEEIFERERKLLEAKYGKSVD